MLSAAGEASKADTCAEESQLHEPEGTPSRRFEARASNVLSSVQDEAEGLGGAIDESHQYQLSAGDEQAGSTRRYPLFQLLPIKRRVSDEVKFKTSGSS